MRLFRELQRQTGGFQVFNSNLAVFTPKPTRVCPHLKEASGFNGFADHRGQPSDAIDMSGHIKRRN